MPPTRIRACLLLAGLQSLVCALTVVPSAAAATISPRGIACPSTSQCTIVYRDGHQVTFDPASPKTASSSVLGAGDPLLGVDCPSASACTAIAAGAREVSFNPTSPGSPTAAAIAPGSELSAIACPASDQCTAVDYQGTQVTFDPGATGSPTVAAIDTPGVLVGVACPSITTCVAIDDTGREATFNPVSTAASVAVSVDDAALDSVACPTAGVCVAVDNRGRAVTFDPFSSSGATTVTIDDGNYLLGVSCGSPSRCTAVDDKGQQASFDVATPGDAKLSIIDPGGVLEGISCPSISRCTAFDNRGLEVMFDTEAGGKVLATGGVAPPSAVGAPTLSNGSLAGLRSHALRLSFTLTSRTRLKRMSLALPRGLGFASSRSSLTRGIRITARGHRVRFVASLRHGELAVRLLTAPSSARITISSPAITISAALARGLRRGRTGILLAWVTTTDGRNAVARRALRLKLA